MKSYGKSEEAFIAMIAIFSEIMWTAAILVALGQSFAIVFEIPSSTLIIISAIVAVAYTARGGMAAVAITDVLQLFLLIFGLIVTFPYFMGDMSFSQLLEIEIPVFQKEFKDLFNYAYPLLLGGIVSSYLFLVEYLGEFISKECYQWKTRKLLKLYQYLQA